MVAGVVGHPGVLVPNLVEEVSRQGHDLATTPLLCIMAGNALAAQERPTAVTLNHAQVSLLTIFMEL